MNNNVYKITTNKQTFQLSFRLKKSLSLGNIFAIHFNSNSTQIYQTNKQNVVYTAQTYKQILDRVEREKKGGK